MNEKYREFCTQNKIFLQTLRVAWFLVHPQQVLPNRKFRRNQTKIINRTSGLEGGWKEAYRLSIPKAQNVFFIGQQGCGTDANGSVAAWAVGFLTQNRKVVRWKPCATMQWVADISYRMASNSMSTVATTSSLTSFEFSANSQSQVCWLWVTSSNSR